MNNANGASSAIEAAEDLIVDDLRKLVANDNTNIQRLEIELADARRVAGRHKKSLEALTGESANSKAKPTKNWTLSEERVEFVLGRFKELVATPEFAEGITPTQLGNTTDGVSHETISRAFVILREREQIRAIANTRGGGKLYALMGAPDGS